MCEEDNKEHLEDNSLNSADDDEKLANKITKLAGQINAAKYRFLKLVAEFDRREAWGGYGIRSCAHWLNWQCGIAMGSAREKVRVARALEGLPGINTAFEKGELSFSKVRAMTRVATDENESYLLMIAEHGTAQHMEKLVKKYRSVIRQGDFEDQDIEVDQQQSREVTYYQDVDGMWIFHARLPAEEGGLLVKTLDAIADRLASSVRSEKNTSSEADGTTETETETDVDSRIETVSEVDADTPHYGAEGVSAETFSDDQASGADTYSIGSEHYNDFDNEPPTMEQHRADALSALAEHFLSGGGSGQGEGMGGGISSMSSLKGAERCQLILHVRPGVGAGISTASTCCDSSGEAGREGDCDDDCDCNREGICSKERPEAESLFHNHLHCELDGHWLPPDAAKTLACDASFLIVKEDELGNLLDIDRRSRIIPPAISRALTIRDGGCQFPGCCETRYVEGHHIKFWGDGGKTKLDNLVTLCRYHHRELHRGSYCLTLEPVTQEPQVFADRLCFTKGENGEIIEANPFRKFSNACDYSAFKDSQPETIDELTAVSQWHGEHMDYGMGVEGLFNANELLGE